MSNTKWRELILALDKLQGVGYRIKFIDAEEVWEASWLIAPSSVYIEGSHFGTVPFVAVEWLEIYLRDAGAVSIDEARVSIDNIAKRLTDRQIPFTELNGSLHVIGYQRLL